VTTEATTDPLARIRTDFMTIERMTQIHVTETLERLDWHMTHAAVALGVDRRTLYRMVERYGIKRPG